MMDGSDTIGQKRECIVQFKLLSQFQNFRIPDFEKYIHLTMTYKNGPNELSIWCCLFQDRILCTKVKMSVHPDDIIFCEKSYKTNFLSSTEDKVR